MHAWRWSLLFCLVLGPLAGCSGLASREVPHGEHLEAADRLAQRDASGLRAVYQDGNDYFREGDLYNALIEYDYAAYGGSAARRPRCCGCA